MAGYLRTNYRLQGALLAMESATDLTTIGAAGEIPSGFLAYSACCLLLYKGDEFLCFEASQSTA